MIVFKRIWYAFVFLSGSARRTSSAPAERFERLIWAMMLLAVGWGLALVAIWDRAYHITFHQRLDWVIPSVLCGGATCL